MNSLGVKVFIAQNPRFYHMLKKEIRVIGIDDSPFDKFRDKKVLIVGVIYRGGHFMDGIISTYVSVDGKDATSKIASMINKCKFKSQLRCILLKGIAVAGFNAIDIKKLNSLTKLPVIVVMRHYPQVKKIENTLIKLKMNSRISLIKNAGEIHKIGNLYVQFSGTTLSQTREFLKITITHSLIPEPLRIAHLIAGGIVDGESRGHA